VNARELGFRLLGHLGVVAAARWRRREAAVVLTYHAVTDMDPSFARRYPLVYRNAVTSDQLQLHIAYLKRHYQLLTAEEFLDSLRRARFPTNAALLTFDDGLQCHARLAGPLLASEGVPGVAFLPTGMIDEATDGRVGWQWTEALAALVYVRGTALRQQWTAARACIGPWLPDAGRAMADDPLIHCLWGAFWRLPPARRLGGLRELAAIAGGLPHPGLFPADRHGTSVLAAMSWPDAQALVAEGVELGGHTVYHSLLSELLPEEAEREILECAERIRQVCTRSAEIFSYPYGTEGDAAALDGALRRAGFRVALTQRYGVVSAAESRPYLLPRIDVPGDCSRPRLAYYLSGLRELTA